MVVATGIFRVVLVAVSCVLAAYEEKLSAADRYGDDLTRFVWNYLGQLLALGKGICGCGSLNRDRTAEDRTEARLT